VSSWDCHQLGVHASIEVANEGDQPPYLMRPHDETLRDRLDRCRDSAISLMLMVVGTSCAGKSRSAYEAVRQVLPDWQLIAPKTDTDLRQDLHDGVPARTVIWLDELERFLTTTADGVASAASIRALISSSQAGPHVIVGTIWPDNLRELSQRPDAADARMGASVIHRLVTEIAPGAIHVADGFSTEEITQAVTRLGRDADDPRLRVALRTAEMVPIGNEEGRAITQVLAGGQQLIERMETSGSSPHKFSTATRALLETACVLRRVGHPNPLPRWLLEEAASDYLPAGALERLGPGWTEIAIVEASQAARENNPFTSTRTHDIHHMGVPALTPLWIREDPASSTYGDAFLLHDYLLQNHIRTSVKPIIRPSLRDALSEPAGITRLPLAVRHSLARELATAGEHSLAGTLAESLEDPISASNVLLRCGFVDRAITRLSPFADFNSNAATRLARILAETGAAEQAVLVLSKFATIPDPVLLAADLLQSLHREAEAIALLEPLSETIIDCAIALCRIYASSGRHGDARAVLDNWIDTHTDAALALASLASARGDDLTQDVVLIARAADSPLVAVRIARALFEVNGFEAWDAAIDILRAHAASNQEASTLLADIYVATGAVETAIDMLAVPAQHLSQPAVRRARLLRERGRNPEATAELKRHADVDPAAALLLADFYVADGKIDDAIDMLVVPAQRLSQPAVRRARLLREQGRNPEATVELNRHAHVSAEAALLLADFCVADGKIDDAIDMLVVPAQRLSQPAVRRAILLRDRGDLPSALAALEPFVGRDVDALIQWADLSIRSGSCAEALARLKRPYKEPSAAFAILRIAENLADLASAWIGRGRPMTTTELLDLLWDQPDERNRLLGLARMRLWGWLLHEKSLAGDLRPKGVASLFDALSSLSPTTDERLKARAFEQICDDAQGSAAVFDSLAGISAASACAEAVLNDVLEPVDRADN
jgi:tetratricopeptide (TPR) repeat protein